MQRFHDVTLQLVRPGPPHNQLLSPLTSYLALCGDSSPVTFHIDMEHRQLINRLEHLRYQVDAPNSGGGAVPDRLRQGAVEGIGEDMGKVFARITSLNAELTAARNAGGAPQDARFVHLRIVLSGSELSLLPFELAISPQSYPGEGLRFCLQGSLPISVTREIQSSRPMPVDWDRKSPPRILFIFAEPANLTVPKLQHLAAIRTALKPWFKMSADGNVESSEIKRHLRVLPNATVEGIYEACAAEQFTHIHILAHGAAFDNAGERQYGVALCRNGAPGQPQVVDGNRLAKALRAEGADGICRSSPLMVTLATCDSGHPGSVLIPGGSIAYDLHVEGIPWVIASQFPLTIPGSIRMAEQFYPRILRGDDPRQVIYELRRYLYLSATNDHDWASIVAYTSMQQRFEERVANFFVDQTKRAMEVQLGWADDLVKKAPRDGAADGQIEAALESAKSLLAGWEGRLPDQAGAATRSQRAECFGMKGSVYKRIGILQSRRGKEFRKDLENASAAYQQGIDEWAADGNKFHWTATQRLALAAILGEPPDKVIHQMAARLAERDLAKAGRLDQAWAHGTLAELALIRPWHEGKMDAEAALSAGEVRAVKKAVLSHCGTIVALLGPSFPVSSTRRQFQRYVDRWYLAEGASPFLRPEIVAIAKAAVGVLTTVP